MLKDVTHYGMVTAIGIVCLGLLALCMIKDTVKEVNVGPFDEE